MAKRKANYDLLRIIAMLGIIMFHHFGSRTPNRFVELSSGFTNSTYFYDFINNVPGKVSSVSLLMDFCYGHLGNGGNLVFMLLTGYFLFGRKITFPKRVRSAGKVLYAILFYGIVLTLINAALLKFAYPFDCFKGYLPLFTLPNWLSGDNMWYLQAYGIFILVILPLLKLFEEKLQVICVLRCPCCLSTSWHIRSICLISGCTRGSLTLFFATISEDTSQSIRCRSA